MHFIPLENLFSNGILLQVENFSMGEVLTTEAWSNISLKGFLSTDSYARA